MIIPQDCSQASDDYMSALIGAYVEGEVSDADMQRCVEQWVAAGNQPPPGGFIENGEDGAPGGDRIGLPMPDVGPTSDPNVITQGLLQILGDRVPRSLPRDVYNADGSISVPRLLSFMQRKGLVWGNVPLLNIQPATERRGFAKGCSPVSNVNDYAKMMSFFLPKVLEQLPSNAAAMPYRSYFKGEAGILVFLPGGQMTESGGRYSREVGQFLAPVAARGRDMRTAPLQIECGGMPYGLYPIGTTAANQPEHLAKFYGWVPWPSTQRMQPYNMDRIWRGKGPIGRGGPPPQTHRECRNGMCVEVEGAGADTCWTNADCEQKAVCASDPDCPAGQVCWQGQCVEAEVVTCSTDDDCLPGTICKGGVCVPEEEKPPGRDKWIEMALIGGAVMGGVLMLYALLKAMRE